MRKSTADKIISSIPNTRIGCKYKALRRFLGEKTTFRKKCLPMKHKVKMPKNTLPVIEQKVRINKVRKNAKKPSPRNTKEYRDWRKSILNKFNHTCSFCGNKEMLELDHIEPVSKRPDLIMTDENARILCKPCHTTTESYPRSLAKLVNKGLMLIWQH